MFWGPEDERNIAERLWGDQTNQRAELWAAIRGSYPYNLINFKDFYLHIHILFIVASGVKFQKHLRRPYAMAILYLFFVFLFSKLLFSEFQIQ